MLFNVYTLNSIFSIFYYLLNIALNSSPSIFSFSRSTFATSVNLSICIVNICSAVLYALSIICLTSTSISAEDPELFDAYSSSENCKNYESYISSFEFNLYNPILGMGFKNLAKCQEILQNVQSSIETMEANC